METTTLQFEEAEITIAGPFTETKRKTYPGKVAVGIGLGYWRDEEEGEPTIYSITHIESGHKVYPSYIYDEQVAQSLVTQIAPLTDWNQPLELLKTNWEVARKVKEAAFDLIAQHPGAFGAKW